MNFNFSQLLDLKGDSAPFSEIRQRIASDASVKGANLVILITAILIASVGLNMNSTAVIIGAMLISPLMGGLVATGYGMATYDMQFIKVSAVSYAFKDGLLTVDLIGTPLTEDQVAELQASMQSYSKLTDAKLHIVQGNVNTIGQKEIQQIITNRIEGLVANDKGKSYKELARLYYPAYQTQQSDEQITVAMNAQLPALFPQIVAAQGSTMPAHSTDASTSGSQSQQFLAKLTVSAPLSPTDAAKIQQWLKTQTDSPVSLIVQMQGQDSSFYGNGIAWE